MIGFIFKDVRNQFGDAAADLLGLAEYIAEVFFQIIQCLLIAVTGQGGFIKEVKTSQLVNPVRMVCMVMRVKDGVNFADVVAQALLPEIGRGVDQNRVAILFYQNG